MSSRRETAFVEARRQSGAAECGMTALEMVLAYHGCKPERERLRRTLGYSPYGASAEMLLAAARDCGFDAGGFDVTIDQLDAVPVPAILHCRRGHFVVYEGKRRSLFCIVDPATGRRRVKRRDLQRLFSGIVVAIEPREAAPGSARQRDRTLSRGLLAAWTSERLPAVAVVGAFVVLEVAAMLSALWFLARGDHLRLAVCGVIYLGAHQASRMVGARLRCRFGDDCARLFADATARVSPAYLASRTQRSLESIATELDPHINRELPGLDASLRLALSPLVLVIALLATPTAGALVATLVSTVIVLSPVLRSRMDHHIAKNDEYGRRVGLARERLRAALQRPQDLHAAGGLRSTLDQWLQARCAVARDWDRSPVRSAEPLVAAVALVLLVEGLQVYAALASVYALALCFLASSEYARLARCWDASGRLGDLLREADTRQFVAPTSDTAPTAPVLECRSLRYGAISGIDLVVHGGDRIAIVGDTGSGKSTMARLLLGQLTPMRGRVLVAGDDVAALLEPERRLRVTGVLADALPMDGTLLTNISASAHSLHREEALRAWSHLGLREWIEEMPLGERTPVAQQGTGWSDHQRRLMTLAPLLVKPAQCLVIDCTLDVLDFRRARSIMRSIASLPCAIVLFTARPEIVSKEYARYTLRGGALGG